MDKNMGVSNTKQAYKFLQKLYFEVSYLIYEIEKSLFNEEEQFVICKSGGYAITSPSSTGLDPIKVKMWPLRKMGVFFVPNHLTKFKQGITHTDLLTNPKILYMHIILDDPKFPEPCIYFGVLFHFSGKKYKRFEKAMRHLEEKASDIFTDSDLIDYEDANIKFKRKIFRNNLYDLNSRNDIDEMIIKPALKVFREIQ